MASQLLEMPLGVDSPGPNKPYIMGLLQLRFELDSSTSSIRVRFEYDSSSIRLQHATTRYEVFRALAYEIVYENQR